MKKGGGRGVPRRGKKGDINWTGRHLGEDLFAEKKREGPSYGKEKGCPRNRSLAMNPEGERRRRREYKISSVKSIKKKKGRFYL